MTYDIWSHRSSTQYSRYLPLNKVSPGMNNKDTKFVHRIAQIVCSGLHISHKIINKVSTGMSNVDTVFVHKIVQIVCSWGQDVSQVKTMHLLEMNKCRCCILTYDHKLPATKYFRYLPRLHKVRTEMNNVDTMFVHRIVQIVSSQG